MPHLFHQRHKCTMKRDDCVVRAHVCYTNESDRGIQLSVDEPNHHVRRISHPKKVNMKISQGLLIVMPIKLRLALGAQYSNQTNFQTYMNFDMQRSILSIRSVTITRIQPLGSIPRLLHRQRNIPVNKAALEQSLINVPNVYSMLIQRHVFQIVCWNWVSFVAMHDFTFRLISHAPP